ncbi:hypothetical protein [Sinorhizobium meliloti]|uniref:hypothetical protein n=1 Tax=Rhizobium meliloti TaxID=382 RepID=UPI003F148F85
MTLDIEMSLDKEGVVFTPELYQKYLSMHREALSRRDATLKSVVLSDVILALLLFGKNITIPGTTLGIQDIPAALHTVAVFSSFNFMMLGVAFFNEQAYQSIVSQFNIRRSKTLEIDPDFLTAADSFTEFHIKLFRPKMNIWGVDFFHPGLGFRMFYGFLSMLLLFGILAVLALHLFIVSFAGYETLTGALLPTAFCIILGVINLAGVLVTLVPSFGFSDSAPVKASTSLVGSTAATVVVAGEKADALKRTD